jgi:hypothetical protein
MARLIVFGVSVAVSTLAMLFGGVGAMMRLAIAEGTYDPIRDDAYAGTIDDFNAALLRKLVVVCVIAAASGVLAVLSRPRNLFAVLERTLRIPSV